MYIFMTRLNSDDVKLHSQCCEKQRSKFPDSAKEKSNCKALFRVLCFRAEAVSGDKLRKCPLSVHVIVMTFVNLTQAQGLEQHETALGYIQQAKEILHVLETEVRVYIYKKETF